jgi:hypothetical protein
MKSSHKELAANIAINLGYSLAFWTLVLIGLAYLDGAM